VAHANKTDTGKTDKTDTGKADTGKADTGKADTGKADTGKTWLFVSGQNARLNELIGLLGCGNEIASIDTAAFGRKAGDLIARCAASSRGINRERQRPATRTFKFKTVK
jgi:hypothetical protein